MEGVGAGMDIQLWATINYVWRDGYVVTVSAVPDQPVSAKVIVETATAKTAKGAERARDALLAEVGQRVRARGDRIVDVVEG